MHKIDLIPLPSKATQSDLVVIADGDFPLEGVAAQIMDSAKIVICCDGAGETYFNQTGKLPHSIVGDGDSISPAFRKKHKNIIHIDNNQENNDLTKAIYYLVNNSLGEDITILGATGKREDHTLANISLLIDYSQISKIKRISMVTDTGVFNPMRGSALFSSRGGQQISIIDVSGGVKVTTHDLKYPLTNALLKGLWSGTLNETLGESFGVDSTGGSLVIYRTF